MSKVFLTKTWGFDPEFYPALGFSNESARTKFLRESSAGDWVVIVGTKGVETAPQHQGKLLGIIQVGTDEIDVEEILKETGKEIPAEHYTENGEYRWRYGLPMLTAKKFSHLPDLKDVVGNYLPGQVWAAFVMDLEANLGLEIKDKILSLATEQVNIAKAKEIVKQRQRAIALRLGRGNTGPGPSTERGGSKIESKESRSYIFELSGVKRPIYKVGYTSDIGKRLIDINKHLVYSVTDLQWKEYKSQVFPSQQEAYNFEQLLHKRLARYLVEGETEIYELKGKTLYQEFMNVFMESEWAVG
ncbi:GIY-YIG nuclease family protein [Vibrio coralliilyticus]|uniref:GIY-YIG nuclease family protein n=1 Tax=Vibrio coralliilyticus TaxID=190893 RepID=UPI00148DCAB0|nr:GIY-YIG nuclease family protein [Vibrio coralliilyticus]NOI28193.1 GIY-YIG nuclease family protein [Vibrio coralliilyticus]NOI49134.1 GIY-YIG nuclease family protein [Vibrio coralliilyticus]